MTNKMYITDRLTTEGLKNFMNFVATQEKITPKNTKFIIDCKSFERKAIECCDYISEKFPGIKFEINCQR